MAQQRAPTGVCETGAHDAGLDPVILAGAAVRAAGDDVKQHLPDGQHRSCNRILDIDVIDTAQQSSAYGPGISKSLFCRVETEFD